MLITPETTEHRTNFCNYLFITIITFDIKYLCTKNIFKQQRVIV